MNSSLNIRCLGLAALVPALLALAACDRGPQPTLTANDLPLAVDDRWVYNVTRTSHGIDSGQQTVLTRIVQERDVEGVLTLERESIDADAGYVEERAFLRKEGDALSEYFFDGYAPFGQPLDSLLTLRFPVGVGDKYVTHVWEDATANDFDGDGIIEPILITRSVHIVSLGDVAVPAGNFADAFLVATTTVQSLTTTRTAETTAITTTLQEWLVPGVGAVKRIITTQYPQSSDSMIWELSGYRVGGTPSETDAPEVITALPAEDSINHPWPKPHLTLNEAMPLGTTPRITLTGPGGETVQGETTADSTNIRFALWEPLEHGTYTMTVDGVVDRLGNEAPPFSQTFEVDLTLPNDAENFVPYAPGNRWVYQVRQEGIGPPIDSRRTETLTDAGSVRGYAALRLETRDVTSGDVLGTSFINKFTAGSYEIFAENETPFGIETDGRLLLRLPLETDDEYTTRNWRGLDSGTDEDGDGLNETINLHEMVDIRNATNTTHAFIDMTGALESNRWLSEEKVFSASGTVSTTRHLIRETLVPGIGVVHRREVHTSPAGFDVYINHSLVAYQLGGARSESIAPVVRLRYPETTGSRETLASVAIDFSEAVDVNAMRNEDFVVRNDSGERINGHIEGSGVQLRFVPEQPLGEGTYRVAVSNVPDLLGNLLPGAGWTFTVDTTPPRVLALSVADGMSGFPIEDDIVIDFSEPLNANNAGWAVQLKADGREVAFTPVVEGNRVRIDPYYLLQRGTSYTLTLNENITDRYGNPLAETVTIGFTTAVGNFLPAQTHPLWARSDAAAVGDVNDDGRNDVAVVTSYSRHLSGFDENILLIFLQQNDGTLSAPITYPVTTTCSLTSVAIGDVTGDARNDIVVGETGCGLRIFQRNSDNSWAVPTHIQGANTSSLQLADMNGDGRTDIVGIGVANMVTLRYQNADGTFNTVTINVNHASRDLAVGDLNGDGRNDILLSGPATTGNNAEQKIIVLLRGANGFAVRPEFSAGNHFEPPRGLAIGDLNNDGRNDVALTYYANKPGARVGVLLQQTDGSLGNVSLYAAHDLPIAIEIADVDQDGRNDVLTTHSGYSQMGVYLQTTASGLDAEALYPVVVDGWNSQALAVGDFNSDGFPDAVVGGPYHLSFLYNAGQ